MTITAAAIRTVPILRLSITLCPLPLGFIPSHAARPSTLPTKDSNATGLGNLFESVFLRTVVCHLSWLNAAVGSDPVRVDEMRSAAATSRVGEGGADGNHRGTI